MRIVWSILFVASVLIVWFFLKLPGYARDLGQWGDADPVISQWFRTLMQPDHPTVPCCGESDAYWADQVETGRNGELIAVITDDRPDEPLRRAHIAVGTRIIVPTNKIKWNKGNPTGHIIIFIAYDQVFCYVQAGGV